MAQFEEGATYHGRYICKHDLIVRITVKRRTPQTIVYKRGTRDELRRRKIHNAGTHNEFIVDGPGISVFARNRVLS